MKSYTKHNGWILCPSKRFPGKLYYFNTINGETAWYNEGEMLGQNCPTTIDRTYSIPQMSSPPHEIPLFRETLRIEPTRINPPSFSDTQINYTNMIPQNETAVFGQAIFPTVLPKYGTNFAWPSAKEVTVRTPPEKNDLTDRDILVQTTNMPLGQRFKNKPVVTFKNDIWSNDVFGVTQKMSSDQGITQKKFLSFSTVQGMTQKTNAPFYFGQATTPKECEPYHDQRTTPNKLFSFANDQGTSPKKLWSFSTAQGPTPIKCVPFSTEQGATPKKFATFSTEQGATPKKYATPKKFATFSTDLDITEKKLFTLNFGQPFGLGQAKVSPFPEQRSIEIRFSKLDLNKDSKRSLISKPVLNLTAKKRSPSEAKPNLFLQCFDQNSKNAALKINGNPFKKPKYDKENIMNQPNTVVNTKLPNKNFAESNMKVASQLLIDRERIDFMPIINLKVNKKPDKKENLHINTENSMKEENLSKKEEIKKKEENSEQNLKTEEQKINEGDLRMLLIAKRRKSGEIGKTNSSQALAGKKIKTTKVDPPPVTPKKKVSFNLNADVYSNSQPHSDLSDSVPQNRDFYYYDEDEIYYTEENDTALKEHTNIPSFSDKSEFWYIVVDTDVLLQEYDFLMSFLKIDAQWRLIIPYKVMSEIRSISRGGSESKNMITLARYRIRSLNISQDNVIVESQVNENISVEDNILSCCIDTMKRNADVILITNNKRLKLNAEIFKISTITSKEFKDICAKKPKINFDIENFKISIPNTRNESQNEIFDDCTFRPIQNTGPKITTNNIENDIDNPILFQKDAAQFSTPKNTKINVKNISHYFHNESTIQPLKENRFNTNESEAVSLYFQNAKESKTDFEFNNLKRKTPSVIENDQQYTNSIFERTTKQMYNGQSQDYENQNFKMELFGEDLNRGGSKSIFSIDDNYDKPVLPEANDVAIDDFLERFKEKTKMLEERIESRQEEFLCNFSQIMVECLSNILSRQNDMKPWTLHEALQYVASLHGRHTTITKTAKTLSDKLYEKNRIIEKMKTNMKADDVIEVIRLGMHLIRYLKPVNRSQSNYIAFKEAEVSIKELIRKIQDPTSDVDLSLKTVCTSHSNCTEPKNRRNFIKEPTEILNYLKKHFAEWATYDKSTDKQFNENCIENYNNTTVFRTNGKNLSLLEINKSNTMSLKIPKADNDKINDDNQGNDEINHNNNLQLNDNAHVDNKTDFDLKAGAKNNPLANANEKYKELKIVIKNTHKTNENCVKHSPSSDITEKIATNQSEYAPKIVRLLPTKNLDELMKKDPKNSNPNTTENSGTISMKNLKLLQAYEERMKSNSLNHNELVVSMSCDDENDEMEIDTSRDSLTLRIDENYYENSNKNSNDPKNDKCNASNDKYHASNDKENDPSKSVNNTYENNSFETNNCCYSMSLDTCVANNIHATNYDDIYRKSPKSNAYNGLNDGHNVKNDDRYGNDDKYDRTSYSTNHFIKENDSPNDSGYGNDSLQAYSVIRTFLFQIHSTFKSVKEFIIQTKKEFDDKITYPKKMKIHKKVEMAYNQTGEIIDKLKSILERESSNNSSLTQVFKIADSQNPVENLTGNYRIMVKQYLDMALRLENALGKILVATEK